MLSASIYGQGIGVCLEITFDASFGNFNNLEGADEVYMHSGISDSVCKPMDGSVALWKDDPVDKQKMTSLGNDRWQIKINDIASFYNIGYKGDKVVSLYDYSSDNNTVAMIFRDKAGLKLGQADESNTCGNTDGLMWINISGENPVPTFDGVSAEFCSETMNIRAFNDFELFEINPNPVIDQLQISFTNKTQNPHQVNIFDLSGKELIQKSVMFHSIGSQNITIDAEIADLQNGMYFIEITDGAYRSKSKFMKM